MRNLLLLPACATLGAAQAQQIDAYRYWFDDDAAGAVTTSLTAAPEVTIAAAWPTGTMRPGFHKVSFQVRDDNGDWSVPQTKVFTRGGHAINGYRFWVNDDVSTLTTGTITPGQEVDLNTLIAPGTLTKSFNLVTIQFKDTDDEYSAPETVVFTKHSGLVNGYEYWIDDDVANLSSGTIGPNEVVDLIADLPTATTNGDHLFTIRFSGANGTWSVPLTTSFSFLTGSEELPGITDMLLFPNPTDGMLSLRLTTDTQRRVDLTVLDASGRAVATIQNWSVAGTDVRAIDLATLPAGPYALRIAENERSATMRFVKR